MKAVVINEFNTLPTLLEVAEPRAGEGEVLVNVEYASVNGMDLMTWLGYIQGTMPYQFPITLGRDFSGTIGAVGRGVTTLKVGDPVFGFLLSMPLQDGTFASQVKVPAISVTKRPAGLDAKTAGALGLAGAAAKIAVDTIAPAVGETVLVSGATGGVGALAVQMAKRRGATVIATATPSKAAFVTDMGADEVVDYTGDLAAAVRSIRPGGVDVVLHFAGDGPALAGLLKTGGRLASTLGVTTEQLSRNDVTATAVMTIPSPGMLDELAIAIANGNLRVPITKSYELRDVAQALKDFAAGASGKLSVFVG